ncbi:ATP-binding protein [Streptomyces sp. AV19]|uniref:ATP-binding protein n=1 Tax=Streptomyces sp. AV19 TaxID=2793068 RepID=UPI0018FEF5F8|nr:ATP-binding protein [Streptomyces sp. AV19]MBH1934426.1 ATP-binding protein [Streptomyces sp. AV19]MDG4533215.1 ATP-binding protein [Streptomyces sp. AV19]
MIRTQLSDRQLTLELTLTPAALHAARHAVHAQLGEWGLDGPTIDDALTVVNELLANVVTHVPDRRCTLRVERRTRALHIRVRDAHRALPVRRDPSADATTGRGLALVGALTGERWHVVPTPDGGKEIHCLLDLPRTARAAVDGTEIVREIFRYGLARPERLRDVVRYTHRACDHRAGGGRCTRRCLRVTVGSVVRAGGQARLLFGGLTPRDVSLTDAAIRVAAGGTGLVLGPGKPPPLWIEQRSPHRLRFWYLFETLSAVRDAGWIPVGAIPDTSLREAILAGATTKGR